MSQHRFSPAVRQYLEGHAVDLDLAHELGVRSDRDAIVYPYTTPRGESYARRRDLSDERRITKQPRNQPLILWWPARRPSPGAEVLLCEGEGDALAACSALNGDGVVVAALPGTGIPTERVTAELAGAGRVYLALDGDKPGREAADRFARALQIFTELRVIKLGDGEDLASRLYNEGDRSTWLRAALSEAREAPKLKLKADSEGYGQAKQADRVRELLAKGIDPVKVDLAELLEDVGAHYRRYVHMSDAQATVMALWTGHAHLLAASRVTPYISITSAEPGCGKTLLLEVAAQLVPRPWLTGRTTAAVLPRKIEKVCPTLLLDESDAGFGGDREYAEALRGILNTGYKRSGTSTVCVGQGANLTYADFSTFCVKAISGLGRLPDTVRERSIPIRLEKLAPDEQVEEFEEEEAEAAGVGMLRDRLEAFAIAGVPRLRGAKPDRPAGLSPRTKEIIKPLLAVADLAGREWPERARRSLLELLGDDGADDQSIGVEVLSDIRDVFDSRGVDRISSAELLEALVAMEERPWCEWRRGEPLTSRGLAKLLKPYRIQTRTIRLDDGTTPKGLLREQFLNAWKRYAPPDPPSYPPQRHNGSSKPETAILYPPQTSGVADRQEAANPHDKRDVAGVADRNAVTGQSTPIPALCRYPAHRSSDHLGDGNRLICGICHPPVFACDLERVA